MENLFNNILINVSEQISIAGTFATMLFALLSGVIIAFTYYKTQNNENYQKSLSVTLLMLPVILAVIILFIGSNIARAFSLAGTLSIIRFRSAPGDVKDIGFIFFDIAAGLACGVGLYAYSLLFVVFLCIVMFVCEYANLFEKKTLCKTLRITIPEDLNFDNVFDDVFEKYTSKYKLTKIRTTDLGSLFELYYTVTMDKDASERDLINEIRCRNSNLSVIITTQPQIIK